jgi:DNA-binding response OmpR family regulator
MQEQPKQQRALIIEPAAHMATLVAVMLRAIGVKSIDTASTLAQAALSLKRFAYDLVLLDGDVGASDGFEFMRTLRQSGEHPNRHVPIIMMASAPGAAMITAARDAGVNEFLRKPFSSEHIKMRLDSINRGNRGFVETAAYSGPDRRRRRVAVKTQRRASDGGDKQSA